MKLTTLIGVLAAALLLASACSVQVGTNINNSNNANASKPANTAPANAAPSNAASTNTNSAATNSNAASNANSSSSSSSEQGSKQDFTLVNETGVEIHKVYISPHDSDDWEEDILGRDTLPSGQSVDIKFNRNEKAAMWDLRVEDSKGNAIEWENLNLLQISKVTLHYKDGKATAETE
jgi:pyruvate/2-oxoglutarate dehydrogenase complex dihydrolipoamide acyltransferase (E2) component